MALISNFEKRYLIKKIRAVISAIITWLGVGTIAFHYLETWSWIDSLYFSVSTLTTVGYGDLVPTTTMSKLFATFYILIGVAIMLTALASIGKELLIRREVRMDKNKKR